MYRQFRGMGYLLQTHETTHASNDPYFASKKNIYYCDKVDWSSSAPSDRDVTTKNTRDFILCFLPCHHLEIREWLSTGWGRVTSVKVRFTLEQATKAQGGGRSVALLYFNLGAGWWLVVNNTSWPLYLRERPGTLCIGGWVAPGPVWTGAENLAFTGIRSPNRPSRSKSLYRLS